MTTEEEERRKAAAWEGLCRENGWCCRLCGALPELGKRMSEDLRDSRYRLIGLVATLALVTLSEKTTISRSLRRPQFRLKQC